jgi:hypothetical protein
MEGIVAILGVAGAMALIWLIGTIRDNGYRDGLRDATPPYEPPIPPGTKAAFKIVLERDFIYLRERVVECESDAEAWKIARRMTIIFPGSSVRSVTRE